MQFDFEELKKIREHKAYPYVRSVLWAALTYGIYALLLLVMSLVLKSAYYNADGTAELVVDPNLLYYALQSLLSVIFMNSVFLTFALYDKWERVHFLERNAEQAYEIKGAAKKALRDMHFWIRLITVCGLFLLLPAVGFSTIPTVFTSLFHKAPLSGFLTNLIAFLCFAAAAFGFLLFSYLDSRKAWLDLKYLKTHAWESKERKRKKKYGFFAMLRRLIGTSVLYCVGVMVLPALFGAIAMAGAILFVLAQIKWTWIILGIALLITYYLCIRRRFLFLRNLKKCCKKYKFKLLAIKHPYRSIFRDSDGYNIAIRANGRTFYCRILASVKKTNKIYLCPDGTCERARLVRMPAPRVVGKRRFVQANQMNLDEGREIFRIVTSFDYRFEAKGEKILLFNPVPKFLFKKVDGTSRPLDNGETVGEYKIYSGNAFLRSLERNST